MKSTKNMIYRSPYNYFELETNNFKALERKLQHCRQICNAEAKKLLRKGVSSTESISYLNSLIESQIALLKAETEQIHQKNLTSIQYFFRRRKADYTEYQKMLEEVRSQLAEKKAEYQNIEELYRQHNPLEKGHLMLDTIPTENPEGGYEDEE